MRLPAHRPALILVDLIMPRMDGWRLIEIVRENLEYAGTQFIGGSGQRNGEAWSAPTHWGSSIWRSSATPTISWRWSNSGWRTPNGRPDDTGRGGGSGRDRFET